MARPSFIPASAPTSPAVTRSKHDRLVPSTPQRAVQPHPRQVSSPYTPATNFSTPYTPLSLRSFSSGNSSNLATPMSETSRRRLSLSLSPEVEFNSKSLADIAENWRSRANENGIKVTSSNEPQHQADKSGLSDLSVSEIDHSLLPAPFLLNQRRARAFTQAQAPLSQIPDPTQLCTPSRAPAIMNTPPPQPAYRLRGSLTDPAHTRRRPAFEQTSELFDIDEDEYTPYPPVFNSAASQSLPLGFNDPFSIHANLSTVSEPLHFYETQNYIINSPPRPKPPADVSACSVCGSTGGSLAVLEPCAHPLCSACLTSALNIVGEKDMECAVCKAKVDDFKLHKMPVPDAAKTMPSREERSFAEEFDSGIALLPSAFEAEGASTPVARRAADDERVVLRIDNVPWDITPPVIAAWLKHPVERVHVLLDRKGKTLSHAYAEMANADAAKAALRTAQNSVLGKGKRARGVTVTRSSQEELMRALFPSWQGNFDGTRPSLAGLDNEHVIATLQRGLCSESELNALLHLVRSPDSHFLKVPSLPFHSLISMLSKFPADDDSRVFWSGSLRDMLYAAVHVLLARIEDNPLSDWAGLMAQVVRAAMECQAFTSDQMSKLSDILEASLPRSASSPLLPPVSPYSPASPQSVVDHSPPPPPRAERDLNMDELAKEFGVEAHLIEALAQRLSGMR
ncbi:hypothetical protein B0H21DRAFT_766100 [Amylocystis lapponica]|nr:hypothetical protein B0H21DRAFT_766100 [Amylocystis lapponica]